MAKGAYVGVDGVARKIKTGYIGVDGVARKIKKAYVGVDGVARLVWESGDSGSGGDGATYKVSYNLSNVESSSNTIGASSLSGYSTVLSPATSYYISTYLVMMGETDITASSCSVVGETIKITIASVTGNIFIMAIGVKKTSSGDETT